MASALFSDRYKVVVAELAAIRRDVDVTQAELASRLKRPQSFVSKIERSERRIDVAEFFEWAEALGIAPEDLFSRVAERMRAVS